MNDEKTRVMDTGPGGNGSGDTRTRWLIGVLVALVVGLGVGLLIVAGDDSQDETTVTVESTEEDETTEATTTEETETVPEETVTEETTTDQDGDTGGTKAPGAQGGFSPGQQ
jgi:hypothetical protein